MNHMHCITIHTAYGGTLHTVHEGTALHEGSRLYTFTHCTQCTYTLHTMYLHTLHTMYLHTLHTMYLHTLHKMYLHTPHTIIHIWRYVVCMRSQTILIPTTTSSLPLLFVSRIKGCFVYMHTNVLQTSSTLCSFLCSLSCTK